MKTRNRVETFRVCDLCHNPTYNEPTVVLVDLKQEPGNQARKAHLACLENNPETNLSILKGDWS